MTLRPAARVSQMLMHSSTKWRLVIWLLLMLGASLWTLQLWQNGARVQSDILAMLPHLQQDKLTERAINQVEATLADQVYIALVAKDETTVIAAAKLLMQKLEADLVATGRNAALTDIRSADMLLGEALGQFYFPHRFKLLTAPQAEALASQNIESLIEAATAQLYNAFSYANSNLLAQDPLLLFPANLLNLAPSSKVRASQGILLANQGDNVAAVIMAKGRESAFNPNAQLAQMAALTAALDAVEKNYPDIIVLKAGALFHAIAATQTAKSEISILGLASLLGVIALVWLAFRSVMPLLLAIVTISSGLLLAVTFTLTVFGELHLLTLVFGTSLIGIAIDYSFHYYCERLQDERSASATVRTIFPTVTLAFITSALAYVGMGLAPFPGMQQVAIFCAAGLLGAYLTLVLAYPQLAGSRLPKGDKPLALANAYLAHLNNISAKASSPLGKGMITIALILWCILGLRQLHVDDDIRHLQQSPPQVTTPENQLRELLSGGTDNQFLLVRAPTEEALLQALEQASPMLETAIDNHELGNYVSLSRYLPSKARQDKHYQQQGILYQTQLENILHNLGLDESLKAPLQAAYVAAKSDYITPSTFFNFAAGQAFAPFWLAPNEDGTAEYGAIVLLGGIQNIDALTARFTSNKAVQLIDKVADISSVMGHYRMLTLTLLALALVIALLLFSLRFGVKKAVTVVAVPALAALLTLATLGLIGSPLSLFHTLALILVFGIGIDYSLFFASAQQHAKAVMMAVFMSACSTLLAFGLLAFSQTQAIHYFGLTLSLGIAFSFLLSPLILPTQRVPNATRNVI